MKTSFLFQARALLVAAILPLVAAAASESPSLLLQKGIYAEEIERNLDSAIKIYEQIAAESAANRAVVVEAQYRLAVCYQKQGKKEQAVKLLNELVQQAPADVVLRTKAREILTQLGVSLSDSVSMRKVATLAPGWFVAASPDGRFLAYQPSDSPDVQVYELATGKIRTIAKGNKNDHVYDASFSPSGTFLAYTLNGLHVWIARVDGTQPARKLLEHGKPGAKYANPALVWTIDWSSDASQLFVGSAASKGDPVVITAVDVTSGSTREVTRIPNATRRGGSALSSDGQFLAVRKGPAGQGKIVVVDLKTGQEATLVESPDPFLVGWASGSARLAFNEGHARSNNQLWAVPVSNGKKKGEPEIVMGDLGALHDGLLTRDGSIYYSEDKYNAARKVVGIDLWVLDGFLTKTIAGRASWQMRTDIPREELMSADGVITDRKSGLGFTVPSGWRFGMATRSGDGRSFVSVQSGYNDPPAAIFVNFRPTTPWQTAESSSPLWDSKQPAPNEADSWLRDFVHRSSQARTSSDATYKLNPASLVTGQIKGGSSLTYEAGYTSEGVAKIELTSRFYSHALVGQFRMIVPAEIIDAVRPAYQQLIATVRLP
jgi:tetratricopeptide (TPR) repeat protein